MGLLRKPYEISYWEDVWQEASGSTPAKYVEKRICTIGSDTMDYQARAIEPVLTRKTNGEVNFSFKMYYQYIDNVTGETVKNPFTDYLKNESKIKLKYNGEWFDLLIKNINKDSATKSYTYQLIDQHIVELSKNGFNVTLDSSLMNNLGTADDLARRSLADTDWEVESEKIVATQDEALVMLTMPSDLSGITIYQINDEDLSNDGAVSNVLTETQRNEMGGKQIYAFYSSCSGEKPYRFQFIYFTETPEIQSDRIITTRNCQYFIDGIDKATGWKVSSNFTIPKDFTIDIRENTPAIGNPSSISTLYRGRRYVYSQTSEYHPGLDMYLEKYVGTATNIKDGYHKYNAGNEWDDWGKLGTKDTWSYYTDGHKPEDGQVFPVGTIVKVENLNTPHNPIYLLVTNSLIKIETGSGSRYVYEAIVINSNSVPYYKYAKTNYVTPNLIQNVVNNAEFKGTSGWKGSKFVDSGAAVGSDIVFKPITSYNGEKKFSRNYTRKQWEIYTLPYSLIDSWTIGKEGDTDVGDRLKAGDYFYLTDCVVGDEGDEAIYPLFQAVSPTEQSWNAISMGYATSINTTDSIIIKRPLSSSEFSATVESVSMNIPENGTTLTSAIDQMLNGEAVIGSSGYKPYLLCGNLHPSVQIGASGQENIGYKTVINNGTSNTIAFQQGITENEKYRFVLDAKLVRKETNCTNNTARPTYIIDSTPISYKIRVAKFNYDSALNGFALTDQTADEFSESVLFSGSKTSISDSEPLELGALGTVTGKEMKEDNYQLFLDFGGVPNPAVDQANEKIYEYYVLIQKIEFYKLYPKEGSGYYSLDDEITTENISYNVEEKYFPVIQNDTRTLEDIEFVPMGTTLKPVLSSDGARKSCVNVKESNYFNIIQSIAQTFECWPKLIVGHDENGNITTKKVKFFNYVGQPNHVGFKYGVNSKDIKRTIDSNQIVSKLIVKANSNEYAPNGFCSIARASQNDSKDNVIYNFGYYANKKLIDPVVLQRDLYSPEDDDAISNLTDKENGGLYISTAITDTNINRYLSECTGYYSKMRPINTRLEELSKLISQNSAPLNEEIAKYNTYKAMYETANSDLGDAQNRFFKLSGFAYNSIPENERNNVLESTTLYPTLQTIAELASTKQDAYTKYINAEQKRIEYEATLKLLNTQYDNAIFLKTTLNRLFYQRYSRFIQEGTWIDESYIDESLYYNDALSVSYNSSMPKVTYSMNVLALAGIPGFELFDFKIGDQTFVEDIEFFGYDTAGNPHREEVTITETSENLDDPTKNTIKIRNYENQFEDLFQRITATVQSVQYTEGSYKKASALAEADAAHKLGFLTEAFNAVDARISDANNTVVVDTSGGTGITISNKNNDQEALRLTSGAILLQGIDPDTGDKIWKTGLTAQGISASLITAGTVNTGEIQIMNGNEPTFRWDTHGITAYDFDNSASDVYLSKINTSQGVRFDRFGIYGYTGINGETWKPTGINEIDENANFALTWEGLKVTGNDGVEARLGRDDKNILSITKGAESILTISNGGDLALTGQITATEGGTIAGWDINKNSITKGTLGTDGFHMYSGESSDNSNKGTNFGNSDTSTYWALGIGQNFGVTMGGAVYASNLNASGGRIGGETSGLNITEDGIGFYLEDSSTTSSINSTFINMEKIAVPKLTTNQLVFGNIFDIAALKVYSDSKPRQNLGEIRIILPATGYEGPNSSEYYFIITSKGRIGMGYVYGEGNNKMLLVDKLIS